MADMAQNREQMPTLAKYRHLSRCTTPDGHFVILAIDHRDNLRNSLNQNASHPISDDEFIDFKLSVVAALSPESSAVLLDPTFGIGPGIATRTIPGHLGLLSPLEVTNYALHPSERPLEWIPHWSVEAIKRIGADGVKLLLPYHPDASSAPDKREAVRQIVEECGRVDLPFFLEPIAHAVRAEEPLRNSELRRIVVDMARTFSELGVDVLKMQFPVDPAQNQSVEEWRTACAELDAACSVPWALLSAGVDFETFALQARVACEAGASGVIVGRAVWAESVTLDSRERASFLVETARPRMRQLACLCQDHARPWFDRVEPPPRDLPLP